MAVYVYVLDEVVLENLINLPARERDRFIALFRIIVSDPYQKGESSFLDPAGRTVEKKCYSVWIISFWPDHAVKEMRIVGIQRVKV